MIDNDEFDDNMVNNDWRPSIVTATLTRNGWVAINGQNRYSVVLIGVNRCETVRIFEINGYCVLREGEGLRIFKLSVDITIDGLLILKILTVLWF